MARDVRLLLNEVRLVSSTEPTGGPPAPFFAPWFDPYGCKTSTVTRPLAAGVHGDDNTLAPSALILLLTLALPLNVNATEPERRLTYEQDVRPILKAHCFQCHGEEEKPKGKLDLRLVRVMKPGGVSGEAIVPGDHEESLLWERIDDDEMPPRDKKLSAEEKATHRRLDRPGGGRPRGPSPPAWPPGLEPTDEEKAFWSFQPIRRPGSPRVQQSKPGPHADRRVPPGAARGGRAAASRPRPTGGP